MATTTSPVAPPIAADAARRGGRLVLSALFFATFFGNVTPVAVSPFLLDIARDLGTDLATLGTFLGIGSVAWGVASAIGGAASDRLGRRPLMLGGLMALTAFPFGMAAATAMWQALAVRLVGGVGGGMFMSTVFAAASDSFPASERGRALGWIVTAQSLAMLLGLPAIAYAGAFLGWRGALGIQGVLMVLAVLAIWLAAPRPPRRAAGDAAPPVTSIVGLLRPRLVVLLAANTMERFCYGGVAVYLATFLLATYQPSMDLVAVGLAVVAAGNLAGSYVGGEVADRVPSKLLLAAASMLGTAALALPLLAWHPGLGLSIGLGFLYAVVNALGRPGLVAVVSEVSDESRGALLGISMTFMSVGWLTSQAVGGWLIAASGFESFGALTAACALVGTALVLVATRLRPAHVTA